MHNEQLSVSNKVCNHRLLEPHFRITEEEKQPGNISRILFPNVKTKEVTNKADESEETGGSSSGLTCCLHPSRLPLPTNPAAERRSADNTATRRRQQEVQRSGLTLAYFSASSLMSLGTNSCRPFVTTEERTRESGVAVTTTFISHHAARTVQVLTFSDPAELQLKGLVFHLVVNDVNSKNGRKKMFEDLTVQRIFTEFNVHSHFSDFFDQFSTRHVLHLSEKRTDKNI